METLKIFDPKNRPIIKKNERAKNAFSLRIISFSETLYFVNTINYILGRRSIDAVKSNFIKM